LNSSKNRVVLGVNAYSHDSGAALFVDGRLCFAAEEERYDRRKHSAAFPRGAIAAALSHAGLTPGDVDLVAFPWRRGMARLRKALYVASRLPRSLPFLTERPEGLPPRLAYLRSIANLPSDLRDAGLEAPVRYVDHHRAHAMQAHRFGPADHAAVLTMDGMGEWTAAATWLIGPASTHRLASRDYPHSLGKVYAAVTQHLGFLPDADEGKTMGLAPLGGDSLVPHFRELLRADPRRLYRVRLDGFAFPLGRTRMGGEPFDRRFGLPRAPGAPLEPGHADLARAAQTVLEEVVLDVARRLRLESGRPHLGLAGGLFLNCVLNARLRADAGFDSVSVFPAAGDAGAAAGAAALVASAPRRELEQAYLGEAIEAAEIDQALAGRSFRIVADPAEVAAEALAAGRDVGWVQGRMEFGPRALGARSILADPRDPGVKDRLNRQVKLREDFRPFAPAVMLEEADAWFERAGPSPFMLLTFRVREARQAAIPGAIHVDGSARVQTVARDHALPVFRRLLEGFARRTGVPMVINTSFNMRGEPIVRTPAEALRVFDRGALSMLVLGDRVVERR